MTHPADISDKRYTARRRFRLFALVALVVLGLSLLKALIHALDFEFLQLNALFTSAIAAAVFIIGFLLSSVLSDYKEADRLPAEIRVALEAIHDDTRVFKGGAGAEIAAIRRALLNIVRDIHGALARRADGDLKPVLSHIDGLTDHFVALEAAGMPPNFIVRLRAEQSVLRRCVFRMSHMQRIEFVPSVHILVKTLVAAIVLLLLFLRTENSPESALIFGAISYMFVYALYLIDTLEQPFRKWKPSLDDVSLFLLREFARKLAPEEDRSASPSSSPLESRTADRVASAPARS